MPLLAACPFQLPDCGSRNRTCLISSLSTKQCTLLSFRLLFSREEWSCCACDDHLGDAGTSSMKHE